jgi:hypothetical protein
MQQEIHIKSAPLENHGTSSVDLISSGES